MRKSSDTRKTHRRTRSAWRQWLPTPTWQQRWWRVKSAAIEMIRRGPRSDEYRKHRFGKANAEAALKKAAAELAKSVEALKEIRASNGSGPNGQALNNLMDLFDLERQAYHKGALVGNDVAKLLKPDSIALFSQLFAPRIRTKLDVEKGGHHRFVCLP